MRIDPDADPVLVGSHLDSQPYGGIYDGALGMIAPLELLRTLEEEGLETRHPIEIVNWTNEEGSRFQPAMQGSGVWIDELDLETEYETTDENGVTVREELERIGYLGEEPAEPGEYEAYFELHIEQGPYLELEGQTSASSRASSASTGVRRPFRRGRPLGTDADALPI